MTMNKQERRAQQLANIASCTGMTFADVCALRRIEMTLHRWAELECGDGSGCIERDEETNRPYWLNSMTGRRAPIADREAGALKRLGKILGKYPQLQTYHQGDPRGCALYIIRPGDVPEGTTVDSCYNRGIAVCA
jgi:hypothetical protein